MDLVARHESPSPHRHWNESPTLWCHLTSIDSLTTLSPRWTSPMQMPLMLLATIDAVEFHTGPKLTSAAASMNLRWKQMPLGTQTHLCSISSHESALLGPLEFLLLGPLAATDAIAATELFTKILGVVHGQFCWSSPTSSGISSRPDRELHRGLSVICSISCRGYIPNQSE
eukprot:g39681.t1